MITIKPPWKKSKADGDIPFVWQSKPKGSRCLWTANWLSGNGVYQPKYLLDFGKLTREQRIQEAWDYAYMGIGDDNISLCCSNALLEYGEDMPEHVLNSILAPARRYVQAGRPEYICWWDLPPRKKHGRTFVQFERWRPGWDPVELPENESAAVAG